MDSKPNNDNGSTGCHKRQYLIDHDWFLNVEYEIMNIIFHAYENMNNSFGWKSDDKN